MKGNWQLKWADTAVNQKQKKKENNTGLLVPNMGG